jgi:CubicO group peptidase (beta-lactamase class C family)
MSASTQIVDSPSTQLLGTARSAVAAAMARYRIPGLSVAVTDADRLVFAEGFGHADLTKRRPATVDTRYLWFSMSKIATATAAMQLSDDGRLDLDAPVRTLVPSFARSSGDQPTVRQLLAHTSGAANPLPVRWVLPADGSATDVRAAARRIVDRHGRPGRPPGGLARYSNIGYLVLAEAIERATGEPFDHHVRRSLLQPAGMVDTGYTHRPDGDYATGYVTLPVGVAPVLRAVMPEGIVGGRHRGHVALRPFRVAGAGYGGLIGSVTDAARLLRLHLADGEIEGRRILTAASAREMRDIRTPGRPFDLGLGWFRPAADRDASPHFVEHWGTGGGFWNAMRLYPDRRLGIVVMANTTRPYDHSALMSAFLMAFAR